MEQLRSNIAAVELTLDDQVLAEIETVHSACSNPCP
jgi:aryl-alcohol dehydrogenase-like predicted oxidoreductase